MAKMGRPKGSRNRRTVLREAGLKDTLEREPGFDPRAYAVSVGRDPRKYNQRKSWAAELLMPYMYPKLSATKIEADVTNHPSGDQVTEAHRLITTALAVPVETNGATNGAANGKTNGASKSDG